MEFFDYFKKKVVGVISIIWFVGCLIGVALNKWHVGTISNRSAALAFTLFNFLFFVFFLLVLKNRTIRNIIIKEGINFQNVRRNVLVTALVFLLFSLGGIISYFWLYLPYASV